MSVLSDRPRPGRAELDRSAPLPECWLSWPEVVVGLAVLALALFAWMALLLVDNHVGWLPAVSACAAAAFVIGCAILYFGAHRPTLRPDPAAWAVLLVIGIVAGVFFFPGFHYGVTDKDPGAYVALGAAFARHGSYSFTDTLAQHVPGITNFDPGERFPAVWIQANHLVVPQFYHLWPALLAMAYDIGGLRLEVQVTPLVALLSVLLFVLLMRRIVPGRASLPAAAAGGLLLATNMLQVWQAKYPSTEAFSQMIFIGLLLGIVVALRTGWAPAAGLSGLLLGVGWLERPDMILSAAVAGVVGAVLLALGRWDRRCTWFAAGLLVTLPHVLWQAYAGAASYTQVAAVPRLRTLVVGAVVLYLLAAGVRLARPVRGWVVPRLEDRRWQFGLGFALCAVALVGMVVGFLRPRLFGLGYQNVAGTLIRTYNEENMHRLAWFITFPGWALVGLGIAVIALRRWRPEPWVPLVPALLIIPVYVENARIASRLMWWGRRFVPEVLPLLLLLIVVALSFPLLLRGIARTTGAVAGAVLFAYLLATFVSQSAPLRQHDEFGGSFQVIDQITATAGHAKGIYLFDRDPCCTTPVWLFGGATWLEGGEYAATMPAQPAQQVAYVRRIAAAFPHDPVFAVLGGSTPPAELAALHPVDVLRVDKSLPMWQESQTARPDVAISIPVNFTVWRLAVG